MSALTLFCLIDSLEEEEPKGGWWPKTKERSVSWKWGKEKCIIVTVHFFPVRYFQNGGNHKTIDNILGKAWMSITQIKNCALVII